MAVSRNLGGPYFVSQFPVKIEWCLRTVILIFATVPNFWTINIIISYNIIVSPNHQQHQQHQHQHQQQQQQQQEEEEDHATTSPNKNVSIFPKVFANSAGKSNEITLSRGLRLASAPPLIRTRMRAARTRTWRNSNHHGWPSWDWGIGSRWWWLVSWWFSHFPKGFFRWWFQPNPSEKYVRQKWVHLAQVSGWK